MLVSAREGYQRWSATYDQTANPVLVLESRVLAPVLGDVRRKRVLDAGCGTGRWMKRLSEAGALVWGVDSCEEMIVAASPRACRLRCSVGDLCRLPFANDAFDLALCSFALSYSGSLHVSLCELSRVARTVVVADLHPETFVRGWKRSFQTEGQNFEIESRPYTINQLDSAAEAAGLNLLTRLEYSFGEPEREIFRIAGREHAFAIASGCPAVLISKWTR